MSVTAVERRSLRGVAHAPAIAVAAAGALLFVRLLPDITAKPWHEDEAVAGLISARPLPDLLRTVVLDRGGAPLHFLLAHAALAVDGSPQTLRWLSVVFAIATVLACYDLARRLAGQVAGVVAAVLAASSQFLTIYGTFGRMYSLFAFAAAVSLDAFVRAVSRPRRETLLTATVAALVVVAVHPFGSFVFAAELAVAVWLWRARAVPAGLLALPLVVPYAHLTRRYAPEVGMSAPNAAVHALGGSAGGRGITLVAFAAIAALGAWTLPRPFAALGLLLILGPPLIISLLLDEPVSARHLIFLLPVWTTFVAAGVAKLPAVVPLAAIALVLAPAAVSDPRAALPAGADSVTAPAAWLRTQVHPGDVLYPYSAVFLAALPETARAHALPREPIALQRAVRRIGGVHDVFIAVPTRGRVQLRGAHAFEGWLIIERRMTFREVPRLLAQLAPSLEGTSAYAGVLQLRAAACRC